MKKIAANKKFFLLGVVLFMYGLFIIPLMVLNSQNRQDTRGRAATSPASIQAATCGNAPTDTVIIIDRSGSMQPANKIGPTKTAAKNFIEIMSQDTRNKVSVVSFSTKATLDSPLTTNYSSAKSKIDAIKADGWTCVECAIKIANQEIAAHGRQGIKKVVVLLTDGQANYIDGTNQQVSTTIADQKALGAAQSGHSTSKTQFFTVGLGDPNATGNEKFFNPDLLKKIASLTAGKFYFPLPSELNNVYKDISLIIGKAAVAGFVFSDTNGNGVYDSGETKVSNWMVKLTASTSGVKTATTNSLGEYKLDGVCDGAYSLKLIPQSGWAQTFPTDPNGHSFEIKNGFSILDKRFGIKKAVPTTIPTSKPSATPKPSAIPTPGVTTLSLIVFLDGIGNRGDNANPTKNSLSNKNPLHPTVDAGVEIFNAANQLVASGTGVVKYNSANGNYTGAITLPSNKLSQGSTPYTVKVKTKRHLRKQLSGIQTITINKTNVLTTVALVTGDINDDNKLNILDYNLLIDCYSDLAGPVACSN